MQPTAHRVNLATASTAAVLVLAVVDNIALALSAGSGEQFFSSVMIVIAAIEVLLLAILTYGVFGGKRAAFGVAAVFVPLIWFISFAQVMGALGLAHTSWVGTVDLVVTIGLVAVYILGLRSSGSPRPAMTVNRGSSGAAGGLAVLISLLLAVEVAAGLWSTSQGESGILLAFPLALISILGGGLMVLEIIGVYGGKRFAMGAAILLMPVVWGLDLAFLPAIGLSGLSGTALQVAGWGGAVALLAFYAMALKRRAGQGA